ncbi:MAG: transposase [Desulforhopalus sp.]
MQDELLVVEWLAKDFPAIKKLAREQKAEIYFGDESSVCSDNHSGTTWASMGKTPVVTTTGTRHKVNLISAISPRGAMRLMATEDNVDGSVFITFLKRLIAGATHPIFLIVDNHSVHRSSQVRISLRTRKVDCACFICRRTLRSLIRMNMLVIILKIIKLASKPQKTVGISISELNA